MNSFIFAKNRFLGFILRDGYFTVERTEFFCAFLRTAAVKDLA
jgi:hypothetical protein